MPPDLSSYQRSVNMLIRPLALSIVLTSSCACRNDPNWFGGLDSARSLIILEGFNSIVLCRVSLFSNRDLILFLAATGDDSGLVCARVGGLNSELESGEDPVEKSLIMRWSSGLEDMRFENWGDLLLKPSCESSLDLDSKASALGGWTSSKSWRSGSFRLEIWTDLGIAFVAALWN